MRSSLYLQILDIGSIRDDTVRHQSTSVSGMSYMRESEVSPPACIKYSFENVTPPAATYLSQKRWLYYICPVFFWSTINCCMARDQHSIVDQVSARWRCVVRFLLFFCFKCRSLRCLSVPSQLVPTLPDCCYGLLEGLHRIRP